MRGGRVDTGWEGRPTAKTSKVRLSIRDRGAALTLVRRGLLLLLPDSDAGYADLPLTLLNAPVNIGETRLRSREPNCVCVEPFCKPLETPTGTPIIFKVHIPVCSLLQACVSGSFKTGFEFAVWSSLSTGNLGA